MALSLVCKDCNAQLRSVAEATQHNEATGHANFEESTDSVSLSKEAIKAIKMLSLKSTMICLQTQNKNLGVFSGAQPCLLDVWKALPQHNRAGVAHKANRPHHVPGQGTSFFLVKAKGTTVLTFSNIPFCCGGLLTLTRMRCCTCSD